jgi:CubicO group peptidase (beta-lactamase class C family)
MHCSGFVLLKNNVVEYIFGDIISIFNIASIRKSLLSTLIGIYWDRGIIDIHKCLSELEIDDSNPGLTSIEKTATIEDLLKMRSGIYHEANFETQNAKDTRPARGAYKPGEHYYYTNWDSNALGTIFSKLTDEDIFEAFDNEIAKKIGMQDFKVDACEYIKDADSIHKAYKFRMSASDLAAFGGAILSNLNTNKTNLVSKDWLEKSLTIYSTDEERKGVGYLWDIAKSGVLWGQFRYPDKSFGFSGYPGHFLLIIPENNTVIVYVHTIDDKEKPFVSSVEFGELIKNIFDS